MKVEIIKKNHTEVAVIESEDCLIKDVSSALDLVMNIKYETGCANIALNCQAIVDDFFQLRTCLAGEILQKFINYGVRFAIYGDFSVFSSKALQDFMYESNQGKNIFFQKSKEEAVNKLAGCADC